LVARYVVAQGFDQLVLLHPGAPGDLVLRGALQQLGARQVGQAGVGGLCGDIGRLGGVLLALRRVSPLLRGGPGVFLLGQRLAAVLR